MLEIPEAVVIAAQINQSLVGKQIAHVVANQTPHTFAWFTGDPAEYHQRLVGKTFDSASAFGGQVEVRVADYYLVLSTSMRCYSAGEKLPKKHQLLLTFSDDSVFICSVQMWGGMMCFKVGEKGGLMDYELAKQLPSPLSPAFTRAYFDSLFDADYGKLSTKEFLATRQRIPGLGNGVLQDILWTARIHPRRKMADLSHKEIDQMYSAVTGVLRQMVDCGGRDTERDLFGNPGGYRTVLSKNTVEQPCPECGTLIKKEAYMGGSIYYCAGCQKY